MKATENDNIATESPYKNQLHKKWGDVIGKGGMTGFVALPDVLIRSQHKLGLKSTEMMVLINILMHWWFAEKDPFPSNKQIAKRMGLNVRTIERTISSLAEKGLVSCEYDKFYDKANNIHSTLRSIALDNLVAKLSVFAKEFEILNEASAEARKKLAAQKQL